jgi:hypothetical protein
MAFEEAAHSSKRLLQLPQKWKAGYLAQKSHCCQQIQALYHDSHGVMGHRKMRVFLQREGISLSKTTVHKYMNRELQLHSICR